MPVSEFRAIADEANLEHEAPWHMCLGWTLVYRRHYLTACEHFTTALHLDLNNWRALHRMVVVNSNLGDYKSTLVTLCEALGRVLPELTAAQRFLYIDKILILLSK